MEIYQTVSMIADLAIIFLLAIQSFVLWKLKDPIISTAKNSEVYKKLFTVTDKITSKYPKYLTDAGINHCKDWKNKNHIHISECY